MGLGVRNAALESRLKAVWEQRRREAESRPKAGLQRVEKTFAQGLTVPTEVYTLV